MRLLADRVGGQPGRIVVYNPLGWDRVAAVPNASGETLLVDVPGFGYTVIGTETRRAVPVTIEEDASSVVLRRGALSISVDKNRGLVTQITSEDFPHGVLHAEAPLCTLQMTRAGEVDHFDQVDVQVEGERIVIDRRGRDGARVIVEVTLAAEIDAVDIRYSAEGLPRPDAWMRAALQTSISTTIPNARLIHDHPYAVSEIRADGKYLRKYPTGEWMTSPQVFEEIVNPFTALSLLDLDDGERGLLYLHDGSQAMLRMDGAPVAVTNILSMYDAWDEDYFVDKLDARFRIVPHGQIDHSTRWKLAQEFRRKALVASTDKPGGDLPERFSPLTIDAHGVAVTAFYRETEENALGLDNYAGSGIGFPYVIRLVEVNGEPAELTLQLPGNVAALYKTNLLGETVETLQVVQGHTPYSQARLSLRPCEIVTLYADIEMGRKMPRNLDEFRFVWATVHRVEENQ
jgi:alpha-mannosidase